MKVFLGSDHAGFEFKNEIKDFLIQEGHDVEDVGALEYDKDDDYPDLIAPAAKKVVENPESRGIVFGGSGQGEAIVANKISGIRCMTFYGPMHAIGAIDVSGQESDDPFDIVRLSRRHNNANMLSIGVRFMNTETAKKAIKI